MLPPELGELVLRTLVRRSDYHDYQRLLECMRDYPQLSNQLKKSYEADVKILNYLGEEIPPIAKQALTAFYGVFDLNDFPDYREIEVKMTFRHNRPVGQVEIFLHCANQDDLYHLFNFTPDGLIDGLGKVEDRSCRREFLHEKGKLIQVKTSHFSPENIQGDHVIVFSNLDSPIVGVKETNAYRMELLRPHHIKVISKFTGHTRMITLELEEERPEVRQAFR
ncbi:MAG: hypothetical protein ACYCQJ_12325 [Nitrososphaerales archaeon]